jgi:hypothetical protein
MRTLIAMLLMALFAQGAVAQIERGTFRIGPTFEFATESDSDEDAKYSQMVIGANASYFVINNLGVGIDLLFATAKADFDGDEATSNSFGIGPQAMYMIGLTEELYVPIHARYLFISEKSDFPFAGEIESSGSLLGFGTGLEYIVGNKLGLRLNVGYEITTLELKDISDSESKSSGLRSGIAVALYF